MDEEDKNKIIKSLIISFFWFFILWFFKIFEVFTKIDLSILGVYPRTTKGLIGIITSPLIHSDFNHLISNSPTLFLLTFVIYYFYPKSASQVFWFIYILQGFLVWLFARQAYHIGASGLIYGLASFMFFIGMMRKDKSSMALSLLIIFLYGGLIWGVLPSDPSVSFESHLLGAVLGFIFALLYRKKDPLKKEEQEETDDYEEEISPEDVYINNDADEVYFNEDEYYDETLEKLKNKKKKK